ncbi:MAG: recombinase family protein, partial [Tenericutes bacterium]|nr:recombinase family protein [Mycoplasmatota bacterium]
MKEHIVKGIIYTRDSLNLEYAVCYIEQISYENDHYKYIFRPFYSIIDLCNASFFQGIPGLKLELRKYEYIRQNKTPTFIYERTPQENREDLWHLLDEVEMNYL